VHIQLYAPNVLWVAFTVPSGSLLPCVGEVFQKEITYHCFVEIVVITDPASTQCPLFRFNNEKDNDANANMQKTIK
jgi:hypothetical protein